MREVNKIPAREYTSDETALKRSELAARIFLYNIKRNTLGGVSGICHIYGGKVSTVTLITHFSYFYCRAKNCKSFILRGNVQTRRTKLLSLRPFFRHKFGDYAHAETRLQLNSNISPPAFETFSSAMYDIIHIYLYAISAVRKNCFSRKHKIVKPLSQISAVSVQVLI